MENSLKMSKQMSTKIVSSFRRDNRITQYSRKIAAVASMRHLVAGKSAHRARIIPVIIKILFRDKRGKNEREKWSDKRNEPIESQG